MIIFKAMKVLRKNFFFGIFKYLFGSFAKAVAFVNPFKCYKNYILSNFVTYLKMMQCATLIHYGFYNRSAIFRL